MAGFIGTVSVTWLTQPGDDRDMKLNQDFSFVDAANLKWTAKKNAVINGASIPQIFWTTFGSPFIGDYRRASVVHDYFCDVRTRPSDATHKMFYEACLAGGVAQAKAKTMYFFVRTFGPSWQTMTANLELAGKVVVPKGKKMAFTHAMTPADVSKITQWIETQNPSIEAIDAEIALHAKPAAVLPLEGTTVSITPG